MKKIIVMALALSLITLPNAQAKTNTTHHYSTHHSYANKGWKHHKLSGTAQTRYLHAISHKKR